MKQKRYKKFKKFLIGIVLISGILCSNQQNAQAKDGYICKHGLHTFGDHTINGGVGNYGYTNRYYWIHNAFSSTYEAYIKKAVSQWVHTTDSLGVTTPISIKKTSTRSKSVFDFLKGTLDVGVLGQTSFYKHGGTLLKLNKKGALSKNYSYAYIKLDTSTLNSSPAAQRQATCAHELGHAMGLSHHMISSSIMCQYGDGRNAKRASKNDLKAINHLYK